MSDLPRLFFRIRENGAAVFRVETETRDRRLELRQIAVVNVRNGEVKPQGGAELEPLDRDEIAAWIEARQAELAGREAQEGRACIERLNLTAQWAQSKADEAALEAVTDDLLLAMHDLRAVLLRKKADRIGAAREAEE